MKFLEFPDWSNELRNLYWNLRACRDNNRRRTIYRHIAKEREKLIGQGIDPETIRRLGLILTTRDRAAQARRTAALKQYEADMEAWRTNQ